MGKISVGGYDDGEGPSNPTQKRRRVEQDPETPRRDEFEGPSGGTEVTEEESEDKEEQEQEQEDHHMAEEDAPEDDGTVGSDDVRGQGNGSLTDDKEKSISITITDTDVLDCFICYEPLSVPVFQCENGHIACSRCCTRLGNKCPMCSMPIGYNRCRAIEKLLESLKISCMNEKYGCKEMISYSRKNEHEHECVHQPCSCPLSGCDFVASSMELSLHFSRRHVGSGIRFTYDNPFPIFINMDDKAIILQEKNDANLFVLHNDLELLGNMVHITCIGPKSKTGFHYDILVRSEESSLLLQSYTKVIQNPAGDLTGLLLIPPDFWRNGQFKLEIRIRSCLEPS